MRCLSRLRVTSIGLALVVALPLAAQQQTGPTSAELKQAQQEVPELVKVLNLTPGSAVADVGAGAGAMTLVLARWLEKGHVFSTEVNLSSAGELRQLVARERLGNVSIVEGSQASTNLPENCCDAVFLRFVYHHLSDPAALNRSLHAALRPGGRLAVIDFRPEKGSDTPAGLPADRAGHGIAPTIVEREVTASGLAFVRTIPSWPPGSKTGDSFLVLATKER